MTPVTPEISVIVPLFNDASRIDACLTALARQETGRSFEVVVVDDGSADNSLSVAQQHAVRVVRQGHAGPAAARNRGVAESKGALLLFTDSDCEPLPDWVERLAAVFDDPDVIAARGRHRTNRTQLIARFAQAEYEVKFAKLASQQTIDFIDTNCGGYRRAVFESVGGFDETLIAAEDVDLSWRLSRRGGRMLFVPGAVVVHDHADSLWSYLRRKYKFGIWRVNVYARHPERMAGDSYTPRSMQVQFLTTWAMLGLGPVAWLTPWLALAWLGAALAFLLSTISFIRAGWQQGPVVGVSAVPVLFLRSVALGAGLGVGLLGRLLRRSADAVGQTERA